MKPGLSAAAALLLVGAGPLAAAKIPREFRSAFEASYRKNETYAVLVRTGIPAMTVYGPNHTYRDGYYAIDVREGEWKSSNEIEQLVTDYLEKGEVMQLAAVSYGDNRVDLRMVALEPRRVPRVSGGKVLDGFEPVAAKLNFFLPFDKSRVLTPADLPVVQKLIEAYVRVFSTESAARAFAARLRPSQVSGAGRAGSPPAAASAPAPKKREIKAGMTAQEVTRILGRPLKEVTFGSSARWTYPDLTVIFENGRVKDVRF